MSDNMDVDLQGILKKRSNEFNCGYFQDNTPKKSVKRVRIELPIGEESDDNDSPNICSPKKRRGLNNQNEIIIPNDIIKNSNSSSINSNNQQQPISQSNFNDEYNKKNRIIITPKSSLISQKLKNMKHNSLKFTNSNMNNNNFLFGTLSLQNENNNLKENNGQFSFCNSSPLSINDFNSNNNNNNNNNKFKSTLSASLSPPIDINSSIKSPNTPAISFSSSLPTSFTFHSPYISNNNPFSNISNNNNSSRGGFSFNYTPNSFINDSDKIIESEEENSSKSNTSSSNVQNQDNTPNTSNASLNSNDSNNRDSNNKIDEDDEDDPDAEREKNSLLSKIARQSFETEKKRYMLHHKNN